MEKINWERRPSVQTGGKVYFWTTVTPQGRFWVVWNKMELLYEVQHDAMQGQGKEALSLVKTVEQGKRIVTEYLKSH